MLGAYDFLDVQLVCCEHKLCKLTRPSAIFLLRCRRRAVNAYSDFLMYVALCISCCVPPFSLAAGQFKCLVSILQQESAFHLVSSWSFDIC